MRPQQPLGTIIIVALILAAAVFAYLFFVGAEGPTEADAPPIMPDEDQLIEEPEGGTQGEP